MYVPPQQLTLGVRWDMVKYKGAIVSSPTLLQCNIMQYVSISETIINLFKRQGFRNSYMKYNQSNENQPTEEIYIDFRSGSFFKTNELFAAYPNSLQIEIATDDFEVCNPLGSKSTLYKVCAVYFSIKNMPPQYRSKLDNIFLVALCHSDDLKTKYTDFNDIWRIVVKDISRLEDGICVGDGLTIKGTLVHLSSDNLAANIALGFAQSFGKTIYYCGFCECDKDECALSHKEISAEKRTKERYAEQLVTIANSRNMSCGKSKGIRSYCELNNLKYYHMLDTMAPDIMHDLNEGIIPFLLTKLFEYCISEKIISEDELKSKIQFHDYGFKNRRNCPSAVNLDKANLNQNASQSMCLFRHIPFILWSLRGNEMLMNSWICVESLLRLTQIAYSSKLYEDDINDLETCIAIHLESIKKHFKTGLLPKHHFVTHYPAIIRLMGPISFMSMMRFESKHQQLKKFANQNNFINITKIMALKHQQMISMVDSSYTDKFENGKLIEVSAEFLGDHYELLTKYFNCGDQIYETKWLEHNIFNYRQGLFVFDKDELFQIDKIIIKGSNFYFFCTRFEFVEFEQFINAIKIRKCYPIFYCILKLSSLDNMNVYEKQVLDEEYYIILDTLELRNYFPSK